MGAYGCPVRVVHIFSEQAALFTMLFSALENLIAEILVDLEHPNLWCSNYFFLERFIGKIWIEKKSIFPTSYELLSCTSRLLFKFWSK